MVAQVATPLEIEIEPDSEMGKLLVLARRRPLRLLSGGEAYRVEVVAGGDAPAVADTTADRKDPFANYDPERALAAWRGTFGILKGLDIEAFKAEMREARGQDSKGRPG